MVFVSATPADYELSQTDGVIVEQVIRPTGLLDPPIEVRPSINQVDDLLAEIHKRIDCNERILVTTLTKRMSEELAKYLAKLSIKVRYIHSEVDTMERVEILRDLRLGDFDVLIGVNLLTDSMQRTIDETNRRRSIQIAYNEAHGIVPRTVARTREEILAQGSILDIRGKNSKAYVEPENPSLAADPLTDYITREQFDKILAQTEKKMKEAAKELDFLSAAQYRDELTALKKKYKDRYGVLKD